MKPVNSFDKWYSQLIILEGIHDKYQKKALFLVGPAGCGKSYIAENLAGFGLKLLDMDVATEYNLIKAGLATPKEIRNKGGVAVTDITDPKERSEAIRKGSMKRLGGEINGSDFSENDNETFKDIRGMASAVTYGGMPGDTGYEGMKSQSQLYMQEKLGVIIAGTGKSYESTMIGIKAFTEQGYDTYMVAVNADLEICQKRNAKRSRSLKPEVIEDIWKQFQSNQPKFEDFFGADYLLFDNTAFRKPTDVAFTDLYRTIKKFLERPIILKDIKSLDASNASPRISGEPKRTFKRSKEEAMQTSYRRPYLKNPYKK